MPLGGLVSLAVLLPNILVLILRPVGGPVDEKKDRTFQIMEIIERIGQAATSTIPFFYPLPQLRGASVDALLVMALALLVYDIGWLRYVVKGHRYVLLGASLFGIPMPMIICPIVYFAAAAIFLRAWPLGVAVAVLAAGHLYVSRVNWSRSQA